MQHVHLERTATFPFFLVFMEQALRRIVTWFDTCLMERMEYAHGCSSLQVSPLGAVMIGVSFQMLCPRRSAHGEIDTWGAADVQAAVAAIPVWMQTVGWNGVGVSLDDWLVSGHSNGGWCSDRILPSQADCLQVKAHGFSSRTNLIRWSLLPLFPDILRLKV